MLKKLKPLCICVGSPLSGADPPIKQRSFIGWWSVDQAQPWQYLCHTCRENGQCRIRWHMVCVSWSQSGHRRWCCGPWRARRSAVQQRSKTMENLDSRWRPCLLYRLPSATGNWSLEGCEVSRLRAVVAARGPSPYQLIRFSWQRHALNVRN
jgi:hypothetical protein